MLRGGNFAICRGFAFGREAIARRRGRARRMSLLLMMAAVQQRRAASRLA